VPDRLPVARRPVCQQRPWLPWLITAPLSANCWRPGWTTNPCHRREAWPRPVIPTARLRG
jgi:hypothetical protein